MNAIEQVYFTWLCDRVNCEYGRSNGKTYTDLLGQLHSKEFVWVVPNDDNRIFDGMDLRNSFLDENSFQDPESLSTHDIPISVLEVIIAISNRLEFITDRSAPDWAWKLIENLELHRFSDPVSPRNQEKIDDILEALIWRNYGPDGSGGLFPLASPKENQLKVEIWYQMHHYLEEMEH